MTDLDQIFRRYPHSPLMRTAARAYRRAWTRARWPGVPLTGSFYWVPRRARHGGIEWTLEEFFDVWRPSTDFAYIWRHVRDSLETHWGRSFALLGHRALPRGRVRHVQHADAFGACQIVVDGIGALSCDPPDMNHIRQAFQLKSEE